LADLLRGDGRLTRAFVTFLAGFFEADDALARIG
jgi:hypothetical protein